MTKNSVVTQMKLDETSAATRACVRKFLPVRRMLEGRLIFGRTTTTWAG